jgi:hypothetical protein
MFFWTKFQSATKGRKVERKEKYLKKKEEKLTMLVKVNSFPQVRKKL